MKWILLAGALPLMGCATIVQGGRTDLSVSVPTPGAEVVIKSFKGREVYSGPSPARVRVATEDAYTIEATAPDHKPQRRVIAKSMSGWAFGNLIWVLPIFWGVGIAVDAASGALWSLDPEDMTIKLVKLPAPSPPPPAPSLPPPDPEPPTK